MYDTKHYLLLVERGKKMINSQYKYLTTSKFKLIAFQFFFYALSQKDFLFSQIWEEVGYLHFDIFFPLQMMSICAWWR